MIKKSFIKKATSKAWETLLREVTPLIGDGYYFDEETKSVWWEGDPEAFLIEFHRKFPWSTTI